MSDYERMKRKAADVRKQEITDMAEHDPAERAKWFFRRPAYAHTQPPDKNGSDDK